MKTQPQIVWKGMSPSPSLDERIQQELAQLDGAYPRITTCRVVIEKPHHHHHHAHYHVKLEVTVPGAVLTVSRNPDQSESSTDAYACVNDAFATLRSQLDDYTALKRGDVKQHTREQR